MNFIRTSSLKALLPALLLALTFTACDKSNDDNGGGSKKVTNNNRNVWQTGMPAEVTDLEFPQLKKSSSVVVAHYTNENRKSLKGRIFNFASEWDYTQHAQRWSCYKMYDGNTGGGAGRYDEGYPHDEDLPKQYLLGRDPYYGSGYQHGHICPSADRQYSKAANRQTFYLSNMQPQLKEFNEVGYAWEEMEEHVRNWNKAAFRDTLYVVKGGTIDNGNVTKYLGFGDSRIPVPKYFFAAVLCKNAMGYKALGFWFEHKRYKQYEDISKYVVNIHELEKKTGIDFFCNLTDDIEQNVENLDVDKVKRAWGF